MGLSASGLSLQRTSDYSRRLRHLPGRLAFWFTILIIVSPAALFFIWMISLSIKPDVDNIAYPPILIPSQPTLDNFAKVFEASPFDLYTINSVIVSGSSTLIALLVGVPAAYGIAKAKAHFLAVFVLISRITPGLSYLIPLYILFRFLSLTNTLWALIITHLVITLPLVIWVMIGFYEELHPELEEAALTDGCNLWQAFLYVSLPLSRPGVVVGAILAFIFSWNNFLFGAVLAGRETRTLPVAIFNVLTFEQVVWGALAAAALLVTLPVLILTVFVQRHIVAGLTAGGVRG